MSAPKSDTATIEARKHRLCELLTEGNTQVNAADILRTEGYPADLRTVQRDVQSLRGQWGGANMSQYEVYRNDQLARIQAKWAEIEADDTMTGAEKHLAWSRWMKLEIDLRGTASPSRSQNLNVNVDQQQVLLIEQQLEYLEAFAGLYPDERLQELDRVKARKRTCRVVLEAPRLEESCGS